MIRTKIVVEWMKSASTALGMDGSKGLMNRRERHGSKVGVA